jgi:hypothetical protein
MGHTLATIIMRESSLLPGGQRGLPHRSVLLGFKSNVFMMGFTQNGRHFPLRAKGRNVSGAQNIALNSVLQLHLITRGCVAWQVAYIYPVTVHTVSSVSVRNSLGANRMPHGADSNRVRE